MFKNGAHYNGIGPYLKDRFGTRIAKVSIDGGFTCPNRDGSAGLGGCIFCSETGSGDFAGKRILGKKTGPKTGGIAVSIPVSYTHLDVYKRQSLIYSFLYAGIPH